MNQVEERDSDSDSETDDITQSFLQELKEQADTSKKNLDVPAWELYVKEHEQDTKPTHTDPNDGTVYEWDEEKRAWFPKVDEDFLATYHASSYQFVEPPAEEDPKENGKAKKRKADDDGEEGQKKGEGAKKKEEGAKKKPDTWFEVDPEKNTNVYVSGMPDDVTEEEFVEMMSKCGIIMEDGDSGKLKIKLYKDESGKAKGDGRCCYLKIESVKLALDLLDESQMRGNTVSVEQAVFQLKGKFNPSLKPKKKKKKKKKKKGQEVLLDWVDRDNCRSKNHRIVIFHYMFDHLEFEKDPAVINEVKADLRGECEKFGDVRKVLIFDRNPAGVCSVAFREPEMADACIEALNGRWFGGKQITVERWDGETNFQIQETEEEKEKRLKEWEDFLESEDS